MSDTIKGIHHVGLTVRDVKAVAHFYTAAAGFTMADEAEASRSIGSDDGHRAAAILRGPNAYVHLLAADPGAPIRSTRREVSEAGIVHICLQTPVIESLYGRFGVAGASFHSPPVDLGTGFLYSYARDCEGNVVELEGVPLVWDDPMPWIAHVSFSSANVNRLADFYAQVFASKAIKSSHIGPDKRFDLVSGMPGTEFMAAWIPAGNMQIEVIQYLQPATTPRVATPLPGEPGYSYVCLEVSDMVSAWNHLAICGAVQVRAPQVGSAIDDEHRRLCSDPDGNLLMLLQPVEAAASIARLPDPYIVARMNDRRAAMAAEKLAKAAVLASQTTSHAGVRA
jgi:catechol 2,3-dioxygenase-like lactoylglutathione lyase family enzyme